MFYQRLQNAWREQASMVCVGLDPDPERIPEGVDPERPYFDFCRQIVDATAPFTCAFKPQAAHFSAYGREAELADLLTYIKDRYPTHIRILDAKRGDVGSTAEFYAREAFERYAADAVTVNPYLGEESVAPFLQYRDRGVIVLCRTSNPDSNWLQALSTDGVPLFERVAMRVAEWNTNGQCMLVAGATYPEELARIRERVGDLPLLVPGVGAQGGDLEAVLAQGADSNGRGLVISSSRGIIYASRGDRADHAKGGANFAEAAGQAASTLRDKIAALHN